MPIQLYRPYKLFVFEIIIRPNIFLLATSITVGCQDTIEPLVCNTQGQYEVGRLPMYICGQGHIDIFSNNHAELTYRKEYSRHRLIFKSMMADD